MTNWDNASKTCASIPQDTAEHNRRELVAFCQGCWHSTDFRYNKGTIAALELMTKLLRTQNRKWHAGQVAWCTHQSKNRKVRWTLSKTRQGARPGQVPQWAIEDNVRWGILDRASVGEWNIDSTRENHRHRTPESFHHEWHHLSTPQRRQHQQNVWS